MKEEFGVSHMDHINENEDKEIKVMGVMGDIPIKKILVNQFNGS